MWSRLWTIALSLFEFLTSNRRCNFGLACLLSILLHNRLTIFTKPFSTYITNIGCELPFCISFSFLHQTVNTILALPACFQTRYFWFPKISVIRGLPVPFCLSFSFFHQILNTILALQLTTFTKSFSAYITNVGSFTSVEPGVYYHFVSLREGLMTKLTRVGSGICEY